MTITALDRIGLEDVRDLAVGSAVLGTGGGGDPFVGRIIAEEAIRETRPVDIIGADQLADDDLVIVVGMGGAPTVMTEKIPNGAEIDGVLDRVVDHIGREPSAMISYEIGGINSLFPVAAAARRDLPLVDADGMGRAFPEFQMSSFNVGGVTFDSLFAADEKGNVIRIDGIDAAWIERIVRQALVAMGGAVMTAIALTGADVRNTAIRGSISLACAVGRALRRPERTSLGWLQRLHEVSPVMPLFEGKITAIDRKIDGGWVRGHATVNGLADAAERQARIDFQNEHLLLRAGVGGEIDQVLCSTPDLLAVLDMETGLPITTEGLHYGQRVTIVGIPCDQIWRRPRGLELAGPRYFGWDIDYVPLEERVCN